MKDNEMRYFSNLFYKVLHMFRTGPLSIISSISTLYTQQQVFVMLVLLASLSMIRITLTDAKRPNMTNTYCVYTVLRYS